MGLWCDTHHGSNPSDHTFFWSFFRNFRVQRARAFSGTVQ